MKFFCVFTYDHLYEDKDLTTYIHFSCSFYSPMEMILSKAPSNELFWKTDTSPVWTTNQIIC